MRKIFTIAVLLITSVASFAQTGKDIYNKWSDNEGVSAVYISPAMFKMIGQLPDIQIEGADGNYMDITPLINSLKGFYILDAENSETPGLHEDVSQLIKKGRYELMMELKDGGETIRIYTKGDKVIESLVFFCRSAEDSQFICIDGSILRSDLESILATATK